MTCYSEETSKDMEQQWNLSGLDRGRWIFPARPEGAVNQIVDFLHRFDCAGPDAGTELLISADTDFAVWLNGCFIGHGQYSDYPDQKTYERLPLGEALRRGANTLAVTVFYNGRDSSVYRRGDPGLVFEVRGPQQLAASGTATLCRPNPCYHSGPIATVSGQLSYTFGYDARGTDGFNEDGYVPGDDWTAIRKEEAVLPEERSVLSPRPVARLVDGGVTPAGLQAVGLFRRDPAVTEAEYGAETAEQTPAGLVLADGTLVSAAWLMQHDYLSTRSSFQFFDLPLGSELATLERGLAVSLDDLGDSDGVYVVVDLGQQEVGHLELEFEAPAGTLLDIGYGEHLDDLRVRTFVGGRNFAARYICREGRQFFTHPFLRWAGRYLAVHIQAATFTLHRLHLRRCEHPVEHRGRLETGNSIHRRILEVGGRTLALCMHEHYEDTPWREQALYANDARTQALCGYYAFGETAFPASSFSLLGRGLREDGFLELTAPARPMVTIPSFTFVWMLAVRDHYLYSGDDSLAKRFLPQLRSMLTAFLAERRDGLLPLRRAEGIWHFYDWSGGMSGYSDSQFDEGLDADAPLNCFLILALEAVRDILGWCGDEGGHALAAAAEEIREGVADRFWDAKEDAFQTHEKAPDLTELTQALAVLAGVGSDEMRECILRRMSRKDSGLLPAGLSQSLYTFQARMTRKDLFGEGVLADIEETWGVMLRAGATTFWETINGANDFHNAGSLCHAWSAAPVYVYYHDLLGIRPLEPGFRSFALDPMPDSLAACSGVVPVPDGEIALSWEHAGDQVRYELSSPESCRPVPAEGIANPEGAITP